MIQNVEGVVGEKQQAIIINEDNEMIEVTCFISQSTRLTAEVTANPVEDGADINDHIKVNPPSITLKGITSDYPLSYTAMIDSVKTLVSGNESVYRSNDTFTAFKDIWENKKVVTVATNYDTYNNMVITSFTTIEDKNNSSSLEFDVTFSYFNTVDTAQDTGINLAGRAAKLSAAAAKKAQKAAQAQNKAKKAAEKVDKAGKKKVVESLLVQILKWIAGV